MCIAALINLINFTRRLFFISISLAFLSIPSLTGLTSKQLVNYANKIRITQVPAQVKKKINTKSDGLPQTTSYLTIPVLKNQVELMFSEDLKRLDKTIDEIKKKELENFDEYYVFYHGQRAEFRLYQDIIKETFSWLNLEKPFADYVYLRTLLDKQPKYRNINQFLEDNKHNLNYGCFDINKEISAILLSVNLSLFGNTSLIGNMVCTFKEYFLNSSNISYYNIEDMLYDFFSTYNFNTKFINKLLQAYNQTITKEGNLLQIFIPKEIIDDYVYLASPCGVPYSETIVKEDFDYKKKRHKRISPILEKYRKNPKSIKNIDKLQARLLLNNKILNPNSGIKIYRYTTVSKQLMDTYQSKIQNIIKEVILDWIESKKFLNFTNQLSQLAKLKLTNP